jgi:nitroreductase
MTQFLTRTSAHDIELLFLQRWSPRAFTGAAMPQEELLRVLEAARWAPSSYNAQPWRFLYAHRDTPAWPKFLGLLTETNRSWAQNAAVLLIALSKKTMGPDGTTPNHAHSFDTGAAWSNLALQATALGWHAHGMVGFDIPRAASELGVPDAYRVEAAIAIGKQGDKAILPETLQARESPNTREPVENFAFEGRFPA